MSSPHAKAPEPSEKDRAMATLLIEGAGLARLPEDRSPTKDDEPTIQWFDEFASDVALALAQAREEGRREAYERAAVLLDALRAAIAERDQAKQLWEADQKAIKKREDERDAAIAERDELASAELGLTKSLKAELKRLIEERDAERAVSARLRATLERYACSSVEHSWGDAGHPCYGYGACKTLTEYQGSDLGSNPPPDAL